MNAMTDREALRAFVTRMDASVSSKRRSMTLHPDVAAWLSGELMHPEDVAAEAFTDMQEMEE